VRAGLLRSIALSACLFAGAAHASASLEIVKEHVDVDVNEDGSYVEVRELAVRPLTSQGVKAIQQLKLSFTRGYQSITIPSAYTLKADGRKIELDRGDFLYGSGATSAPGFEDVQTLTAVFRNVEVGDQVVYTAVFRQMQPWFTHQFSESYVFPRAAISDDTRVRLTAPSTALKLKIDTLGVDSGTVTNAGSETLWEWHYKNAVAADDETGAVNDETDEPHVSISTFSGYDDVARIYAENIKGKADVTKPIQTLADQLTQGITDRREQARALYDWVSAHVSYVEIVLGAGGFIPHEADEVLTSRFGDCKDHVMLLQALLSAKGIDSSPVLINALDEYKLSAASSPSAFNHLITYVPEFHCSWIQRRAMRPSAGCRWATPESPSCWSAAVRSCARRSLPPATRRSAPLRTSGSPMTEALTARRRSSPTVRWRPRCAPMSNPSRRIPSRSISARHWDRAPAASSIVASRRNFCRAMLLQPAITSPTS
jgi:hypothetical protein